MVVVGFGKFGCVVGFICGGGYDNGVSRVWLVGVGDVCYSV